MSLKAQGQRRYKKELAAKRELEIAVQTMLEVDRRAKESELKVNEVSARINRIEAEIIRIAESNPEDARLGRLASDIVTLTKDLDFKKGINERLLRIYENMNQLVSKIEACISLGWYRFVIRTIPEKKLPDLINSENPNDMNTLKALVLTILDKIERRLKRDSQSQEIFEENSSRLVAEERAQSKKRQEAQAEASRAVLASILAKAKGKTEAEMPMPIANAKDADEDNVRRA